MYGPGDPHGAYGPNAFARSLARERGLRLFGSGEEERDHIYVDDAAQIIGSLVAALARARPITATTVPVTTGGSR